jgi:hypothetical protein
MTSKERVDRLDHAYVLVESVQNTLDLSSDPCECCQREHYDNFEEVLMDKTLQGVVNRLGRAKNNLKDQVSP